MKLFQQANHWASWGYVPPAFVDEDLPEVLLLVVLFFALAKLLLRLLIENSIPNCGFHDR